MDIAKRDALLALIGNVNEKSVVIDLNTFFDGNDDSGSIWCNLSIAPEPKDVLEKLEEVRKRDDVDDIKILVTQYDGGDEEWPFSDTIYFITSADENELIAFLGQDYQPDEVWIENQAAELHSINLPSGMKLVAAWWD